MLRSGSFPMRSTSRRGMLDVNQPYPGLGCRARNAMPIRLLIVDDRAVVRAELRAALALFRSVTVAGEAVDGTDALRQARALQPDAVLLDLEMPGMDGYEAARRLKAACPAPVVIALTVHADAVSRRKAVEAGADAFIVKGTDLRRILHTIEDLVPQRSKDE